MALGVGNSGHVARRVEFCSTRIGQRCLRVTWLTFLPPCPGFTYLDELTTRTCGPVEYLCPSKGITSLFVPSLRSVRCVLSALGREGAVESGAQSPMEISSKNHSPNIALRCSGILRFIAHVNFSGSRKTGLLLFVAYERLLRLTPGQHTCVIVHRTMSQCIMSVVKLQATSVS